MEEREGNWQEFETWLEELQTRNFRRGMLFRGQTSFEWYLETTLERSGHSPMPIADYYALAVGKVGPDVSAVSAMQAPSFREDLFFKILDYEKYKEDIFNEFAFPGGEYFEYAAYLRHHGFPSPLLDWSRSPYVAAFFAFRDAAPRVEKRAIFAYCDRPQGTWSATIGAPSIRLLAGGGRRPRRHFFQQSVYTVCESGRDGKWQFDSHQRVFDNPHPKQDFLGKFIIPSIERDRIMRLLDQYNLNAYSLFESEESLLETLWLRANRR